MSDEEVDDDLDPIEEWIERLHRWRGEDDATRRIRLTHPEEEED